MSDEEINIAQDLLGLVGLKVTKAEVKSWSKKRREKILDWAGACHLRASDNPVKVPPQPKFKAKEFIF